MKRTLIVLGIVVPLVCAGFLFKYISDEAAWQKAQDCLIRVRSGMQYESILMVRSKLADADAALEDYASRWRVFPLRHNKRMKFARNGISYLADALDWSGKTTPEMHADTDPADAIALAQYPDVTTLLPRWCDNGELAFDPRAATAAWGMYGDYWLELAKGKSEKEPKGLQPPLDPHRESQECEQKQIAIVKAQNAALKARDDALRRAEVDAVRSKNAAEKAEEAAFLAKYPYEVQFSSHWPCAFVLSVDGGTASTIRLNNGAPESFRMQHSMTLQDASCDVYSVDRPPFRTPESEVRIAINGSQYSPKWVQENRRTEDNLPTFRTTITEPGK